MRATVVVIMIAAMSAPAQPAADGIAALASEVFAKARAAADGGGTLSSDGAALAWGTSYVLMAYLSMYEATGRQEYMDRFLEQCDWILAHRDDRQGVTDDYRGRAIAAWSTLQFGNDGRRYAWPVHAGMIAYPMARWVYLAKSRPNLTAAHADRIGRYQADMEQTLAAFDDCWRDGPGEQQGRYYDPWLKTEMPWNQQHALGRTLVAMWLATGRGKYRDRASRLAASFKQALHRDGDAYVWGYGGPTVWTEDISHGAISVDFAFVCYRAGIVFTAADMDGFINSFRRLPRGPEGFSECVDGTGTMVHSAQAGRWMHLSYLAPELRQIYGRYVADHWQENPVAAMLGSAYMVETAEEMGMDQPVVDPVHWHGKAMTRTTGDARGEAGSRTDPASQTGPDDGSTLPKQP
jgi:hypothetical protein